MPQKRYNDQLYAGRQGLPAFEPRHVSTFINDYNRTAQVDDVTIDSAANSTEYSFVLNGVTLSYTTDGGTSTTESATAMAAAINASALVNGAVSATSAAAVVTITSRIAGLAFTLETAAHYTIAHTTANVTASTVPPGVGIVRQSPTAAQKRRGAQILNTLLAAQVVVMTPTAVNSAVYIAGAKSQGVTVLAQTTADGSATVQEIVEALAAALDPEFAAVTVVVTEDNATLILTSEIAGKLFEPVVGGSSASGAIVVTSDTGMTNYLTDVNKALVGVSMSTQTLELQSDGSWVYPANSAMDVLDDGVIWVKTAVSTVDPSDPVYIGVTSGVRGLWTNTPTTGYLQLDPAKFKWHSPVQSMSDYTGTLANHAQLRVLI